MLTIVSDFHAVSFASSDDNQEISRMIFSNAFDSNIETDRMVYTALKRMGISVSIDSMTMDSALEGANSGRYDGICTQSITTTSSYPNLIRVPVETARVQFLAYTRPDSQSEFENWSDLAGYRVGSLEHKTGIRNTIPSTVISHIEYGTMASLSEGLLNGECDVIVVTNTSSSEMHMPTLLRQAGVLEERPSYIFLHRRYEELIPKLTRTINAMKVDGTFDLIQQGKPIIKTNTQSVLYLSSYSSEMVWEQNLNEGIGSVLNLYRDIVYHNVGMNSLRMINAENRDLNTLSALRADLMVAPPQAVIVSDNAALEFLLNYYNVLFSDLPVVVCSISHQNLSLIESMQGAFPVTGILDCPSASEVAEQMLKMFPDTKKIFIINDYSDSGRLWQQEIAEQLSSMSAQVEFIYNKDVPVDELLETVSLLDDDTLILSGRYFLDANDLYMTQAEFQERLGFSAHTPIFGLRGSCIGFGQLGGKYTDGVYQGKIAAQMVVDILTTKKPLPALVSAGEENDWIFDYDVMEHYGIPVSALPPGSQIINRELTLRESDPMMFYSAIILSVTSVITIVSLGTFVYLLTRQRRRLLNTQRRLIVAEQQAVENAREAVYIKNRLQKILETAPISYSLLVNGVLKEHNLCYAETLGYEIGENVLLLYDASRIDQVLSPLKTGEPVKSVLVNARKKNGQFSRFLCSVALTDYHGEKALMFWNVEIEELERRKDELARAYDDLQRIIEVNPIPIVLLSPTHSSILFANDAFAELFKFPNREMASGYRIQGNLSKLPILPLLRNALETDKMSSWEWEFKTMEGMPFETMVYARRVFFNTEECLVMALKDLTQERARERLLEAAIHREKEANRLKRHFLMNMSHEIRTPLNAIIGLAQLVKQSDDCERLYETIQQIGNASSLLRGIVDNVLDLSMIEEGRMVLNPEQHSLGAIMTSLMQVMDVEALKRDITGILDMRNVRHDCVIVDASRMDQVLMALLSNAIKYSPDRSHVNINIFESEVCDGMAEYKFTITDNGIGIPEDKQSRLFKSFEQVDDSITRRHGGAGLGLVLAKNIAAVMGGDISFTSEANHGSTFTFTVKLEVVEMKAEMPPTEEGEPDDEEGSITFPNLRALIVDDVDINRIIAAGLLDELCIESDEAENGFSALEMVQASEPGYYDFVLMDIQMPVMDGYSAAQAIRTLDRADAKSLPILAISANSMPEDIEQAIESGMNGHIPKPFYLEQLISAIKLLVLKQ